MTRTIVALTEGGRIVVMTRAPTYSDNKQWQHVTPTRANIAALRRAADRLEQEARE